MFSVTVANMLNSTVGCSAGFYDLCTKNMTNGKPTKLINQALMAHAAKTPVL